MPDIILPGRRDASSAGPSSQTLPDPDPLSGLPDHVREAVVRQTELA
jgi:hypothetical protein